MTIGSGTSKPKKKYYYYKCNERTNIGQRCKCPNVGREKLDEIVFRSVEKHILAPRRLEELLGQVIELSDGKRQQLEQELTRACAERTRRRTAINRLLGLTEEGITNPSDPEFAQRLNDNRSAVAAITSRIDVLESQLALALKVEVSDERVTISGPRSVLERGLAKGLPHLDRERSHL